MAFELQDEARTIAGVSCMGLYYYGARYLDSKYSTWISTDPALGDYIPQAPINDEARKHNQNLPGMGGIFNHINCNLYAYGANNPVRYIDPEGNDIKDITLYSASIGAVGAVRFSLGVSIDSNGNTAVFAKFEFGIGAGTTVIDNSIAQIAELIDFGDLSSSVELLLSVIDFAEFVDNLPEDTGQGNLNDLPIADYLLNKIPVSKKFESIKDWKTFPVEGAVLIGAKGDKDGKVSFTFGLNGKIEKIF